MAYAVKEIFLTLQGEGAHAGRPAVFAASPAAISGRAGSPTGPMRVPILRHRFRRDRRNAGGRYAGRGAREVIDAQWGAEPDRFVVLTGGEPLLQVDAALSRRCTGAALRLRWKPMAPSIRRRASTGFASARKREPRRGAPGTRMKLVYPQAGAPPEDFGGLAFERFSLQPMDGPDVAKNTARALDYA